APHFRADARAGITNDRTLDLGGKRAENLHAFNRHELWLLLNCEFSLAARHQLAGKIIRGEFGLTLELLGEPHLLRELREEHAREAAAGRIRISHRLGVEYRCFEGFRRRDIGSGRALPDADCLRWTREIALRSRGDFAVLAE